MSRVYGDSTPFPHDIDYIHMLRDGVDCAVRLLSAQHSIRAAGERADTSERAKRLEVEELNRLFERIQSAASESINEGMDRTVRTAAQVVAGARSMVDAAIGELEAQGALELEQARHIAEKARETTASAVEHFLSQHAPPGSKLSLQLLAGADAVVGHVTMVAPFGVSAVFAAAIPAQHPWARAPRVAELVPQLEIQMPVESGWLSKKVEMTPVRLDRLFVSDVSFNDRSGVLRLRKSAASGSGYQLRVDVDNGVATAISPLDEDGAVEESRMLQLQGADQAAVLNLWQLVIESCRDLLHQRGRMVSGAFAEQPLNAQESPRAIAEALVNDMAPLVVEISRRSGAPGELVLRRNLGEGRREETYLTHSELVQKILVLPPDLRSVFVPLHLSGSLASGGPPPPLPSFADDAAEPEGAPGSDPAASAPPRVDAAALAARSSRPPSVPPPENTPLA